MGESVITIKSPDIRQTDRSNPSTRSAIFTISYLFPFILPRTLHWLMAVCLSDHGDTLSVEGVNLITRSAVYSNIEKLDHWLRGVRIGTPKLCIF